MKPESNDQQAHSMQPSADGSELDWSKGDGLVPAIVQHAFDGRVLMLGYMNQAAFKATLAGRKVTFFSRSRQRLWTKGESSGHVLKLVSIRHDCDRDSLLIQALPQGPTCHLGSSSCFGEDSWPELSFLSRLEQIVQQRAGQGDDRSYTARLLADGRLRCAQKVGEEGVEVALAAATGDQGALNNEAADLLYHLLVCLQASGSDLEQVLAVLRSRHRSD